MMGLWQQAPGERGFHKTYTERDLIPGDYSLCTARVLTRTKTIDQYKYHTSTCSQLKVLANREGNIVGGLQS
jgi:hypothetical protein